jgi:hypothetical protein
LKAIPIVGPLITKAENLYNRIKQKVESQGWFQIGADIVTGILNGLKSTPIIGGLIEQFESIKQWWVGLQESGFWKSMGQSIFGGLAQGASENGQSFVDTIGKYMDDAVNAVISRVQPGSPSKVGRFYGANFMEGIEAGVLDRGGRMVKATRDQVRAMTDVARQEARSGINVEMSLRAARQAEAQSAERMQPRQHRVSSPVAPVNGGVGAAGGTQTKRVEVHLTADPVVTDTGVNVRELEGAIYDIVYDALSG